MRAKVAKIYLSGKFIWVIFLWKYFAD